MTLDLLYTQITASYTVRNFFALYILSTQLMLPFFKMKSYLKYITGQKYLQEVI